MPRISTVLQTTRRKHQVPAEYGEPSMNFLQRISAAAAIALTMTATGALAAPQSTASIQMVAAKTQSTAGHKTIQPVKSTPRRKSRCYG
jgi:hypothetical protein